MPHGLKRYQTQGQLHFITFSCYHRLPYLNTPHTRDIFETSLESTRVRYSLRILGYVLMPEHAHLLLSEPEHEPLSKALQALKLSVSKQSEQKPFWQTRYHDFNVLTTYKINEKLNYIHNNPVKRELVEKPEDWRWSSATYYLTSQQGKVTIEP